MENTKTTYTAAGNTANAVSRTICFLSLQRSSGKRRANLPAEKLEWDIFRRSKSASSWPVHFAPPSGRWCVESGHPAL